MLTWSPSWLTASSSRPRSEMGTPFCPLLADTVGEGAAPTLHILLSPSDELVALRNQLSDVQAQLLDLRQEFSRLEFLYRQEVIVNMELLDTCRAHGVKVRRSLFDRAVARAGEVEPSPMG